jgi:hypothetical protein
MLCSRQDKPFYEKGMNRFALWCFALLMAGATSGVAHAQVASADTSARPSSDDRPGFWLELGVGGGLVDSTGAGVAVFAGARLQQRRMLWSVRWDGVADGWSSDVAQLALLVGVATTRSDARFASVSAGVGYVSQTICDRSCGFLSNASQRITHGAHSVGVTIAAETSLRAGHSGGVGIGLTSAANINTASSFVAAGLSVSFGRWR